jgi:hypothetical protein
VVARQGLQESGYGEFCQCVCSSINVKSRELQYVVLIVDNVVLYS